MTEYMDYASPHTQFTFDVNTNTLYRKDADNYINLLGIKQLNTLENTSLLDIFLSRGNIVEPHYHQNAAELVYCISGAAVVSLINPFTNELLHFPITPGQVANVPQGWWHYEIANVDNTHLLAIFDAPVPEVVLGSDLLSRTPASVLAYTYCLDEAKLKEVLAPVKGGQFIGPPLGCDKVLAESVNNKKPANVQAQAVQPVGNKQPVGYQQPLGYQQPAGYQLPVGYQQSPQQGYYTQGYSQYYRQQPYYQPYPAYPNAGQQV